MTKYIITIIAGAMLAPLSASAATQFKAESVLASGKWVKIKVGENGIYEISDEQLRQFGFTDPQKVKVFGVGGILTTEDYSADYTDDLEQVPAMRVGDKVYFYANGLAYEQIKLIDYSAFDIYRSISINPYSPASYYFLTDSDAFEARTVETVATNEAQIAQANVWESNGVTTWWHKKEMVNPTRSGKLFLGEDFASAKTFSITAPTPGIVSGSNAVVEISAGIKSANQQMLTLNAAGTEIAEKTITTTADAAIYKLYDAHGSVAVTDAIASQGEITARVDVSETMSIAKMDYVSVSYKTPLSLPADSSQMRWLVKNGSERTGVTFGNVSATSHAWLVYTPSSNPRKVYNTKQYDLVTDAEGNGSIVPALKTAAYAEYVLFDTDKRQKQVAFAGDVANQNLHALSAPDMLIITTPSLKQQAERVADYHREYDGMDVAVVLQDDVFNEFGSGMRDAMAYRNICKMLYTRAPLKFRYLLLFGPGYYDNRGILGGDIEETLLTYQSDNSVHSVMSYNTDDFFGVMNDDAKTVEGQTAMLNLSIGRIPFASPSEAKTYVDKLLAYMTHKSDRNDTWKSNMTVIGEYGDEYVHTQQTESFIKNFNYEITPATATAPEVRKPNDYAVNFNKIYLEPYDNIDNLQATRSKLVEDFNVGQNFILFIGHSNVASMTKPEVLMNMQQAIDTKYDVPPVMYFSSCDVGRFDCGQSSFIDKLLLNPEGGIIAAIAATREAYTTMNGRMTDAFGKYLGISEDDARFYKNHEKTWGRVLMFAKNYTTDRTRNRLKYHLLGDPAMKVDLPHNRTVVTEVNGNSSEGTVNVGTMTPITVTGCVNTADGLTNTQFNGHARIALYDSEKYYMTQKSETVTERGAELAVTSADVKDGKFTATIMVPNCVTTDDLEKPLQVTAVADDGTVVSGYYHGIRLDRSLSAATDDVTAPTINAFYIDDQATFTDGMEVPATFRLKAEVADNVALNMSHEQIATTAYITIDGGDRTFPICNYQSDGIDKCIIDQGVYDLTVGRHTAELVVADMAGNVATRTISFYVETGDDAVLTANRTAVVNRVTFDVEGVDNYNDAELMITNSHGDVMMRSQVGSFPYTWDATDNNGNRLAEGVYNAIAIIGGKSLPAKKIVVIKQ